MQTQPWARVKQASLAFLFLVTLLFAFGERLPSLGAALLQAPPPSTTCLSQTTDGYTFDFLGYLPNDDGTTNLSFRVTTRNKKEIGYLAFGVGAWTPVAPVSASTVSGSLGVYRVEWTNQQGNPGFASIKYETQFNGYSQGQADHFLLRMAGFDAAQTMTIEVKAGKERTRAAFLLNDPVCNLAPTPTPTAPAPTATPTAMTTPVSPLPTPTATTSERTLPLPAPLPPELANTSIHVVTDGDFDHEWSAAEKEASWARGLSVPATITVAHELLGNAAAHLAYAKAGLMAPVPLPMQQAMVNGWNTLYSDNLDGGFPAPGPHGEC